LQHYPITKLGQTKHSSLQSVAAKVKLQVYTSEILVGPAKWLRPRRLKRGAIVWWGHQDLERRSPMNPFSDREDAAINGVNAALGVILLISPWLIGFATEPSATWSAVIGGAVISVMALAAFTRLLEWEEWINLIAGLCVAASPWLLGFMPVAGATWTHLIVGLMVAALAAIEIWRIHAPPPARPV
jgi:hypothetical protein